MNNKEVVELFVAGMTAKNKNLESVESGDGLVLYSYAMQIASWTGQRTGLPVVDIVERSMSPSQTTSRHIGMVHTALAFTSAARFGKEVDSF